MTDKIKTVNKTQLSNGEIRYYEDSFARENITNLNEQVENISVDIETKQDKLTAGENITIDENNVISAEAASSYNNLSDLPSINNITIEGDKSPSDFGLTGTLTAGNGISITTDAEGNSTITNTQTSAEWGNIQGDISDQVDLYDALNNKQDKLTAGSYITIEKNSQGQTIISTPGGDYNSLDNKPTIDGHTIQGDMSASELINLGSIGVSSFINDAGYIKQNAINDHNQNLGAHADIRQAINTEVGNRESADTNLQEQIDALSSSSDVIDILGSYAELQRYDTSHVKENDIIKVIQDETRENAVVYYRWVLDSDSEGNPIYDSEGNRIGHWEFIGEQGPYYTSSQVDDKFVPQLRKINNKPLNQDITLHYSDLGQIPDDAILSDQPIIFKVNADEFIDYDSEGNLIKTPDANTGETVGIITLNQSSPGVINYKIPKNVNELTGYDTLALKDNYYTKSETDLALSGKQDNLTAGNRISITNNTISFQDYTAGTGVNITNDVISADTETLATKTYVDDELTSGLATKQDTLTPGSGIRISKDGDDTVIETVTSPTTWGSIEGTLANQTDLNNVLTGLRTDVNSKQDELIQGSNITINGNTISAIDTKYTAGNGLSLTNNEFAIDSTVTATKTDLASKQDKLTAGTNISISAANVISATGASWGSISGTLSDQIDLNSALNGKQDTISDLSTIRSNAELGASAVQPEDLIQGSGISITKDTSTGSITIANTQTSAEWGNIQGNISSQTDLQDALDDKVDKVTGMGLSQNSYTTTEKDKLAGITSGAQVNVIESISKNGTALTISNKNVDITVPTKTSDLTNDGNGATPSDPFATESDVNTVDTKLTNLETRVDNIISTGGEPNTINHIQKNGVELPITNKTVNVTVPTKVSDLTNDTGFGTITEVTAGSGLTGGGTTGSISLGHSNSITAQTTSGLYPIKIDAQGHITEYGEALDLHEMVILRYGVSKWSDFIDAYRHNAIVYCRASSNSNPASGSQTRMAFMAYVNNAANPTNVEFQYYRSVSGHTFDLQGDEVYIYKLESNNNWSVTVRKAYSKVDTENGLAYTFSGGTSSVVKLKANLQSETKLSNDSAAATEVSGRVYPVALDKSGYLAVNVPWTDSVNDVKVNGTSILSSGVADLITNTAYDSTDNKIATMSDVSSMGTVKSVQVAATGPIQSSQNTSQTETLSTTISLADAYGDTKNPYGSKTKNFVLASPSNANGTPSFRALTTADIPNITVSKISDFPTIPDKTSDLTNDSDFISDSSYVHTDNNFTTILKNKLDGIAAGAEVNVQSDWNETDSTSDAYIKNKPSIPEGASAGTTVTAVGTTAVVGTSTSFAREDHVHNITSSTITSALGFTPYNSTNPNGYQTASQVSTAVAGEATLRTNADADLQSQIDALSASSDVVDVVGTYADLQDYDTTTLHNNAIIKVLNDSTHDNSIGYFRWVITSGTGSWSYIGAEGPYYTVAETDTLLGDYVPTSRKVGAVDLSANVKLSGSFSGTSKSISVSGTPTGNIIISKGTGTANYTPSGSNAKSAVTISPKTTSVYSITSVGSKTNGTAASFKQGTDTFTANTPTVIDTSKFSGGSFTRGSFSGGSFTQGTDSFTANVPTKIDTSKFSGGSFTRGSFSGGSFTQGTDSFVAPVLTFTPNSSTGNLTISWSAGSFVQGSDSYTAATHDADSFTAASLGTGFYTVGSAAKFTQGSDSFTAATHGNDSFTAAKLNSGFYTAGTAASFSQGEDEFTANTPTSVTLPERSQVTGLWNGYNTGVDNTYAAAQTFTGDGAELKGAFSGTSFTSTGTYKPEGSVTVTASH